MRTLRLALPLLLIWTASPCPAQTKPQPVEASLEKALQGVKPKDPRLVGDRWFGLYLRGKSLGTLQLTVHGRDRYGFHATLVSKYRLGTSKVSLKETLVVDQGLRLLSYTREQSEGSDPVTVVKLTQQKGGQSWTFEAREEKEKPLGRTLRSKGWLVFGFAHRLLLAQVLDPSRRAKYRAVEPSPEGKHLRALSLVMKPSKRGGASLRLIPPGGEGWLLRLRGKSGRVVAAYDLGHPDLAFLRAKDAADARANRPIRLPYAPGSARSVALELMRGLVRGDGKRVGATIDWPTFFKNMDGEGELKAFKARFLERVGALKQELDIDPLELERVAPRLSVEKLKDGRRRVRVPGESTRFLLAKVGKAWRVVDLE